MGFIAQNLNGRKKKITKFFISFILIAFLVLLLFWEYTSHMYSHLLISISLFVVLDISLYVFLYKRIWVRFPLKKKVIFSIGYSSPFLLILLTAILPYFTPYQEWDPIILSRYLGVVFVVVLTKGIFCIVYLMGISHFVIRKNSKKKSDIAFKRLIKYYTIVSYFMCILCIAFLGVAFLYAEERVDVDKITVNIKNLPIEFKGYKIVHITDLHLGSVNDETMHKVVRMINEQKPDMVCFTGDIVTYSSSEVEKYIPLLKSIKAKDGIYAVLGNHDYGTYFHSRDTNTQENEADKIKLYISDSLHWKLLMNERIQIKKDTSLLVVVGVENMSIKKRFVSKGNLSVAFKDYNSNINIPVILLNHNPDIWTPLITKHYPFINLTLSGHTHGMQLGIPIGEKEVKNAKETKSRMYGLYKHEEQYLYVSKGIGSSLLHGRLGMWADIAVITLDN